MSGGFADLGLMPELLSAVEDMGWILPTDIQDEAIPLILGGGDMMGAAETGSGKTAAFSLPVLQLICERLKGSTSSRKRRIGATEVTVKLNEFDKDSIIDVSPDGFSCAHRETSGWAGIRATHGVRTGKVYFEVAVKRAGGCRVGWTTATSNLDIGKDNQGFGYGGAGFKSNRGKYEAYGGTFTAGDVIGAFLDFESSIIVFSKNGVMLDKAFDLPEELSSGSTVFFPTIALSNSEVDVCFGQSAPRFAASNAAFLLIQKLHDSSLFDSNDSETDVYPRSGKRLPIAIIIEPTRDLAEQVYENIIDMSKYLNDPPLQTLLLIGDNASVAAKKSLQRDDVDIIVGTMGKIQGCLDNNSLDLSHIRHFVLDEADKLLSSDNLEAVQRIFARCPRGGAGENRLQVCFFSATLHSPGIQQLAQTMCQNPILVDLKGKDLTIPTSLHHVVCVVDPRQPLPAALQNTTCQAITDGVHGEGVYGSVRDEETRALYAALPEKERWSLSLKQQKPWLVKALLDHFDMPQCLIFCRTNLDCLNLAAFFSAVSRTASTSGASAVPAQGKGGSMVVERYSSRVLGSTLSQEERRQSLQLFKSQEVRLLICTDVAARGIDIDGLPFVINVTLPDEPEHYVHRIGRVGRKGCTGLAISLVSAAPEEKVWFHTCKSRGGQLVKNRYTCTSRALTSAGGCSVYFNESQMLQTIENHLKASVLRLSMDPASAAFALPEEYAKMGLTYGQAAAEEVDPTAKKVYLTEKVRGRLRQLVDLETQAQNLFLSFSAHQRK